MDRGTSAGHAISFAVRFEHYDADTVLVVVAGELGMESAAPFRHALLPAVTGSTVVLDLSGVTFCDSVGLRALVDTQLHTAVGRGALRLVDPSEAITRLLRITGMDGVFTVFRDADTAIRA